MSKYLPHAQVKIYLPSQSSSVNFQSFCQTEGYVKEVLARSTQMSGTFAHFLMLLTLSTNLQPHQINCVSTGANL